MLKKNLTKSLAGCEGHNIEGYRLVTLLAEGEHSELWSAVSIQGELCVLKLFHSENTDDAKEEYSKAVSLKHSNILSPIAFFSEGAQPVMVLPFCKGRSVDALAGHMRERFLWQLVRDVSSALENIHSKGWGHLSVNPSNILWDGTSFMLSDFGSCAVEGVVMEGVVSDGGAYQYNAPERFSRVTSACDIWSLGATVFYLYMGCHVFNALGGSVQQPHSPLPYMRKSMPALSELIMNCLAYTPSERPPASFIHERACEELERGSFLQKERPKKLRDSWQAAEKSRGFWPDDMIE